MGWQPIETAPRDRVILVGYDSEAGKKLEPHQRVYEARWDERQQTWTSRNGFILHSHATHWMPFPPAPDATSPASQVGEDHGSFSQEAKIPTARADKGAGQ